MHTFDLSMPMNDIKETLPPKGKIVLLRGVSSYRLNGRPDIRLGYYEPAIPVAPWRTVNDNSVRDDGFMATHWAYVIPPKA